MVPVEKNREPKIAAAANIDKKLTGGTEIKVQMFGWIATVIISISQLSRSAIISDEREIPAAYRNDRVIISVVEGVWIEK